MSIPAGSGTKVTKGEGLQNPKTESAGVITSDSLAAESMEHHGVFAANNPSVAPIAAERNDDDDDLDAGRSSDKASGVGPTYNTPGDERAAAARAGGSSGPGSAEYNTRTGSGKNVGTAPTYVVADVLNQPLPETAKPKGRNITEGGFDSDAPNASFSGDIGGKNDPGRAAELKFAEMNAQAAHDAGSGPRQKEITGDGQFDVLKEESA